MKFNTSWGSIRSGEDGSLKNGDDGSRYAGEWGAKGLDFPLCITSQYTQEVLFHSIVNKQLVAPCDEFGDLQ